MIFVGSHPQVRCVVLGSSRAQVNNPFVFKHGLLFSDQAHGKMVTKDPFVHLSEVLIFSGLVTSKKEFSRKLKEGAIRYSNSSAEPEKIDKDFPLFYSDPSIWHLVVLGQRKLEIVIPEDPVSVKALLRAQFSLLLKCKFKDFFVSSFNLGRWFIANFPDGRYFVWDLN